MINICKKKAKEGPKRSANAKRELEAAGDCLNSLTTLNFVESAKKGL